MTLGSFVKISVTSVFVLVFARVDFANAIAPLAVPSSKSASAEICNSLDGQLMTIRSFGDTLGTLVLFSPDPATKPLSKDGFTFRKEAGGVTRTNEVTHEMFELMAEPFGAGTVIKPRNVWAKTYEVLFSGTVTVIDDQAKEVGKAQMNCNTALVEYL